MTTTVRLRRAIGGSAIAGAALAGALMPAGSAAAQPVSAPEKVRTPRIVPGHVIKPEPKVLPLAPGYRLTGTFGDSGGLWSSTHTGLDFAASYGTPIRSVAAGTVVSSGYDGSYGYKTVVSLPDGTELWYCHQATVRVTSGQEVAPGEVIGTVGTSGNVTGPHLHLEVRIGGEPVDPSTWLRSWGLRP